RLNAIEAQLSSGASSDFVKLSKEHAELAPTVAAIKAYREARKETEQNEHLIADSAAERELRSMAEEEMPVLRERMGALERNLKLQLLPKDAADNSNAIVEIRAGTGGDEA